MIVKEQRNIETNELKGYLLEGMFVPLDKANRHYQEIQKWVAEGNTPEPAYTDEERFEYLKRSKLKEINNAFESTMNAIVADYPELEKLSWDKQEKEARAYKEDNTASTPLIDKIAEARGIDKDILVDKIIEKADAYALAVGEAIGRRQYLEDLINNATTIEELETIQW